MSPYRTLSLPQQRRWSLRCWLHWHHWMPNVVVLADRFYEAPPDDYLYTPTSVVVLAVKIIRVRMTTLRIRTCRRCGLDWIEQYSTETVKTQDGAIVEHEPRKVYWGPNIGK